MIPVFAQGETTPRCDHSQIESAIQKSLEGQTVRFEMEHTRCERLWAVSSGTLGPFIKPENGPIGAPTSIMLHYDRSRWQVVNKALSCGTYNAKKPSAFPKNAKVPRALYLEACLAG
jgi:hypothetical protein